MANRLAHETSPYLRQHAENPVDWFPWGDEAVATARAGDRPVLLSVGYSSCHWCHVMAHESFEDPDTAALMNDWFVNVKVDREERPDVDAIYMEATQAMTGHGGWPMTVFMTPDGAPFFCGTYFPSERRGGQPSFRELLTAVHEAWTERREELLEQAGRLTEALERQAPPAGGDELPGTELLEEATMSALAALDDQWGGFGRAPKFPQAMTLGHLLRHHARTGSATALEAVTTSLDAMASGGIYDHVGGGFARYSVDERWLVPHFEKMLYDNALLVRLYAQALQVTGDERYLQVLEETVGYVLHDLSHPDGGRYSAEDADSLPRAGADHAEEGAFATWTPDEVHAALAAAGMEDRTDAVCAWYGITPGGNFEGRSIPNRLHDRGNWVRPPEITEARAALFAAARTRPRPGLDDKVLTEWNGLFLAGLADAAAATGREDWLAEAERTATFLCDRLRRDDGRWLRSWQADADEGRGAARHLAYAADYGGLLDGFLALHSATGRQRWLAEAEAVADGIVELFWDPAGGVFTTGDDAEALLTRPQELMDNATPSAVSLAAVGFLRLEALTGETRHGEHARTLLRRYGPLAGRHALGFGNLLWAVELAAVGVTEVVVTGDRPDLVGAVQRRFLPGAVLTWGERGDGPLWEGRDEEGADGRAYVCRNHACRAPATTVEDLLAELTPAD
ncbi:MAG: thioredoxin domain-containing protein [Microthrixaceae bacterium]